MMTRILMPIGFAQHKKSGVNDSDQITIFIVNGCLRATISSLRPNKPCSD
jgi:hypothetical protein